MNGTHVRSCYDTYNTALSKQLLHNKVQTYGSSSTRYGLCGVLLIEHKIQAGSGIAHTQLVLVLYEIRVLVRRLHAIFLSLKMCDDFVSATGSAGKENIGLGLFRRWGDNWRRLWPHHNMHATYCIFMHLVIIMVRGFASQRHTYTYLVYNIYIYSHFLQATINTWWYY